MPEPSRELLPGSARSGGSLSGLYRQTCRRLRDLLADTQWTLMLGAADPLSSPLTGLQWIVPPADRSWADPFVVYHQGTHFVFIEELPHRTRKGHISVIEVDRHCHCSHPAKLLERPYHLSYPFVFPWRGDFYLIPESSANRTIDAYRCVCFPDRWIYHATLMREVCAVDTTLLHYQDRWWLFANIAAGKKASTRDSLFLFSSDQPLGDAWIPHPQNPIVADIRRARPAGRIFQRDGQLYRPSQDCSVRYGYAVRMHRITCLSATEYAEEEVCVHQPGRGLIALHTLNHAAGLTAIDVKWRRWKWRARPPSARSIPSP